MMQGLIDVRDRVDAMRVQLDKASALLGSVADLLEGARTDLPTLTATRVVPALPPSTVATPRRQKRLAKRAATLKARLTGSSGTSALVLGAVTRGADTLAAIAEDCRVKPGQARTAILALEDAGRVQREGKGRATRYVHRHVGEAAMLQILGWVGIIVVALVYVALWAATWWMPTPEDRPAPPCAPGPKHRRVS